MNQFVVVLCVCVCTEMKNGAASKQVGCFDNDHTTVTATDEKIEKEKRERERDREGEGGKEVKMQSIKIAVVEQTKIAPS